VDNTTPDIGEVITFSGDTWSNTPTSYTWKIYVDAVLASTQANGVFDTTGLSGSEVITATVSATNAAGTTVATAASNSATVQAALACNVAHEQSIVGLGFSDGQFGGWLNRKYIAFKFTADGGGGVRCGLYLAISKVGSPTSNMTANVWSHNSGSDQPNVPIGTASTPLALSTFD
jgi:hypothetical protein